MFLYSTGQGLIDDFYTLFGMDPDPSLTPLIVVLLSIILFYILFYGFKVLLSVFEWRVK